MPKLSLDSRISRRPRRLSQGAKAILCYLRSAFYAVLSILCYLCYAISDVRSMLSTLCYLRHTIHAVYHCYAAVAMLSLLCYLCSAMLQSSRERRDRGHSTPHARCGTETAHCSQGHTPLLLSSISEGICAHAQLQHMETKRAARQPLRFSANVCLTRQSQTATHLASANK